MQWTWWTLDVLDARDVVDGFAVAGEDEPHCVQNIGKGPQGIEELELGIMHGRVMCSTQRKKRGVRSCFPQVKRGWGKRLRKA
jgi:hypothetical protein